MMVGINAQAFFGLPPTGLRPKGWEKRTLAIQIGELASDRVHLALHMSRATMTMTIYMPYLTVMGIICKLTSRTEARPLKTLVQLQK